jgi:hypothetical protein
MLLGVACARSTGRLRERTQNSLDFATRSWMEGKMRIERPAALPRSEIHLCLCSDATSLPSLCRLRTVLCLWDCECSGWRAAAVHRAMACSMWTYALHLFASPSSLHSRPADWTRCRTSLRARQAGLSSPRCCSDWKVDANELLQPAPGDDDSTVRKRRRWYSPRHTHSFT